LHTWALLLFILVLLPVVLLSLPLSFKAVGYLDTQERQLEASIKWAWGLLAATLEVQGRKTSLLLRLAGAKLPKPRHKKDPTVEAKQEKEQARRAARAAQKQAQHKDRARRGLSAVTAALNLNLLLAILKTLQGIIKACNLRLQLNGRYGTTDPALTGLVAGLINVLPMEQGGLNVHPDFSGPDLELVGKASGRVIPMVILWLALQLLIAKPVARLWWPSLISKFKKNKLKEGIQHV